MAFPAPRVPKARQNVPANSYDGIYDVAESYNRTISSAYIEFTSPMIKSAWLELLQRQGTVLQLYRSPMTSVTHAALDSTSLEYTENANFASHGFDPPCLAMRVALLSRACSPQPSAHFTLCNSNIRTTIY